MCKQPLHVTDRPRAPVCVTQPAFCGAERVALQRGPHLPQREQDHRVKVSVHLDFTVFDNKKKTPQARAPKASHLQQREEQHGVEVVPQVR